MQKDVVSFDSSIEGIREISRDIDNLITKGQMKSQDKKEWEKRKEDIRELLKEEVDCRIAEERADAVEVRDEQWNEHIKQNYIEKEVVKDFENEIKLRDATINDLKSENIQKDKFLESKEFEISSLNSYHHQEKEDLKSQIGYYYWENQKLMGENLAMNNYINSQLEIDVFSWQKALEHDRELLNYEKVEFDDYVNAQQLNLDKLFIESNRRLKDVEKREKEVTEIEEKLLKHRQYSKWLEK